MVADEIELINGMLKDICNLLGHEATQFQYASGSSLAQSFVNIVGINNEVVVTDVPLIEALMVYFDSHITDIITDSQNIDFANLFYNIMTKHFVLMNVNEFFIPVSLIKHNKKHNSELRQFVIVEVPKDFWGGDICAEVTQLVITNTFIGISPSAKTPYYDDASECLDDYISALVRCIILKKLQPDAIKISD